MKLQVSRELRDVVEENQISLKRAIILHQTVYRKLLQDPEGPENEEFRETLAVAEKNVLRLGLEQKIILHKLRTELSQQGKLTQKNVNKVVVEEKKQQLSSNIARSRKQDIVPKASPKASCSDESNEDSSDSPSPPLVNFETPELLAKIDFLKYFSLTTIEHSKVLKKKRVERKRRSTAIRDFIYESDLPAKRRKTNNYPSISPPTTRQAVKKKNGRGSPPRKEERAKLLKKSSSESLPEIANENSNDYSNLSCLICNVCRNDGAVIQCELCLEGYHENCDVPNFLGSSKRCPGCSKKKKSKKRPEKLAEKQKLQDRNESLCDQLNRLQERHSQLGISLKNQKVRQDELLSDRLNTEGKIKRLLNFIEAVKRPPVVIDNT